MSVIELREMLVESHRPHFNKERSEYVYAARQAQERGV